MSFLGPCCPAPLCCIAVHDCLMMTERINDELVAELLKMFRVSDVAEEVATRKDRFVNRYALTSSAVCEICILFCVVKFFSLLF